MSIQPVTLEKYHGEREILPASLWPGLVLGGAALRAWQVARDRNKLGMHLESLEGIWLPAAKSSNEDLRALQTRAEQNDREGLARSLSRVCLNETACWLPSSEHEDFLVEAAKLDTFSNPLEDMSPEARKAINVCGTEECQYPRHFDITYSVPSNRRELLYPNPAYFTNEGEAGVRTIWGDRLPPVDHSRELLRAFQQACSPYVEPKESLLTVGGIAQISLTPQTGCWFVRSYFMTPVGIGGYDNWQYDGYGRLRVPSHQSEKFAGFPNYAILGHRVTWLLSGRPLERGKVLNHRCGFRPCANPDHIEQITTRENNEHGVVMKRAIQGYLLS